MNAAAIRDSPVAAAAAATGIDWHEVAAVAAAARVFAGVDRHGVSAIVAVGVNRGDIAVADRLAARERNGEPRNCHAGENPIAKHRTSPCLRDRDRPPCGRAALRSTVAA